MAEAVEVEKAKIEERCATHSREKIRQHFAWNQIVVDRSDAMIVVVVVVAEAHVEFEQNPDVVADHGAGREIAHGIGQDRDRGTSGDTDEMTTPESMECEASKCQWSSTSRVYEKKASATSQTSRKKLWSSELKLTAMMWFEEPRRSGVCEKMPTTWNSVDCCCYC